VSEAVNLQATGHPATEQIWSSMYVLPAQDRITVYAPLTVGGVPQPYTNGKIALFTYIVCD